MLKFKSIIVDEKGNEIKNIRALTAKILIVLAINIYFTAINLLKKEHINEPKEPNSTKH